MKVDRFILILLLPLYIIGTLIGVIYFWVTDYNIFSCITVSIFWIAFVIISAWQLRKDYEALIYPNEYTIRIWDGTGWSRNQCRGKNKLHAIKRYRKKHKLAKEYIYIEVINSREL